MNKISNFEKVTKFFTVFCMGFFGLLAQTLLFRIFLAVFDGNELSIGLFFFSWLIWVCIGAWTAQKHFISKLATYFYILIILYLPLYLIQQYLFINAQTLLGGSSFELISLNFLIPFVLLCNAPISFMTGFLFVLGTSWMKESSVPVIKIYICESLGSFIGALTVTLFLFAGYIDESIFLIAAFIVLFSTLPHILCLSGFIGRLYKISMSCLTVLVLFMLFTNYPEKWSNHNNHVEWHSLLQDGKYEGVFSTPQAKYLYGTYKGEFIVTAWNSTYEALPNTETASRIAGEYLSQKPKAERILVIGPGSYSICRTFNKLPQIKKIVWLDSDPDYPKHLLEIMPAKYQTETKVIETSEYDVRKYLHTTDTRFDLILLNLPNPSTLLLNRYFTYEFFQQLKNITTPNGVVGINFPAGANYMGTELSFMGSSLLYTLRQVYEDIVLKPGDESCFFAAGNKGIVSDNGTILQNRLNTVKDIRTLFNPKNIMSVFEANRIAFQMKRYDKIINEYPSKMFLNSDKNPKSFLYTLLFTVKKLGSVGFSISELNITLQAVFPWMIVIILVYLLLRSFYYYYFGIKTSNHRDRFTNLSNVELYFGVFAAAISGLGINLILIFLFQIYFGSVFLYFGLITALFMLGLFISGLMVEKLLQLFQSKNLFSLISLLFLLYILLIYINPPVFSKNYFALLFSCTGLFCGPYFALAAFCLKKQNIPEIESGSRLEIIDNLGGAIGSILCSVILLPIIGINRTLIIMALLLGILFLHSLFLRGRMQKKTAGRVFTTRTIGFFMLGTALIFIFGLNISREIRKTTKPTQTTWKLTNQQIHELTVNNHKLFQNKKEISGKSCTYYIVKDNKQTVGYIFRTKDYTDDIHGYAGPIHMLSYVNSDGEIQNFTILESNETPTYLNRILNSKDIFLGQNIFTNLEDYQLNAITGATMTSSAISRILYNAGTKFSATVSGSPKELRELKKSDSIYSLLPLIILLLFTIAAIVLRYFKNRTLRYCFLSAVFIVLGVGFNIQYSIDQVLSLISFRLYMSYFNTFLFLCLIIPILIILFGNIYCGYICPFGAFQELLYNIIHFVLRKLGLTKQEGNLNREIWRFGSSIKYIILFILVIIFVSLQNKNIAEETDILQYIFSFIYPPERILFFIIAIIIISMVYKRFWCRVLCPPGAFLSLFNAIRIIRKPKLNIQISNCDLGIYSKKDIDCICCDNCNTARLPIKANLPHPKSKIYNYLFVALCIICFCYMITQMYSGYNKKRESDIEARIKPHLQEKPAAKTKKQVKTIQFSKKIPPIKSIGTPKNIDIQKYKDYINKGNLSDKEAMYYKTVSP